MNADLTSGTSSDQPAIGEGVRSEANRTTSVRLVPLDDASRDAVFGAEMANFADEKVRVGEWSPAEASRRALSEFGPAFQREVSEATARGDRLWSAVDDRGRFVGWVWVSAGDGSEVAAFLHQITVVESRRRQGYGRAILDAVEAELARDGSHELCLHVMVGNVPARRMYAAAGYELVDEDERRTRLRKRLRT